MDGIKRFVETIRGIGWGLSRDENIAKARKIVSELNRFLYARNDGLGTLQVLGQEVSYFSEFHQFWEAHHEEILDISIDDVACAKVAEVLHGTYEQTEGKAFREIYDTCGLDDAAVCRDRHVLAVAVQRDAVERQHAVVVDHASAAECVGVAPDRGDTAVARCALIRIFRVRLVGGGQDHSLSGGQHG